MQETFKTMSQDMVKRLKNAGLGAKPNAFAPLKRVPFSKLVAIHDHEERFLKDVFFQNLVTVHTARMGGSMKGTQVDRSDVKTALLMLGVAARNADNATFSRQSSAIIVSICPYC